MAGQLLVRNVDTLAAYLRDAAARSFRWGECDCCLFAADWAAQRLGTDPAAAWRGAYADEAGALRFVADAGGMVALIDSAIGPERFAELPARGDVGVVETARGAAAAICVSRHRWAMKSPRGIIVAACAARAAWTLA